MITERKRYELGLSSSYQPTALRALAYQHRYRLIGAVVVVCIPLIILILIAIAADERPISVMAHKIVAGYLHENGFQMSRAKPGALIGLWREQFRVSHFQGLRQHERLHVHELASVHQLSELAELDLNHRNVLVLGRNSATLRDAIRAPIRREIKSHPLG
jgi:hypothetical protein